MAEKTPMPEKLPYAEAAERAMQCILDHKKRPEEVAVLERCIKTAVSQDRAQIAAVIAAMFDRPVSFYEVHALLRELTFRLQQGADEEVKIGLPLPDAPTLYQVTEVVPVAQRPPSVWRQAADLVSSAGRYVRSGRWLKRLHGRRTAVPRAGR